MSARYKIICGCECYIFAKSVHSSLLSWHDRYLEILKYKIQNAQSRGPCEKPHYIYETYKNKVMPHGHHIFSKASDMANATICTYPQSDHTLTHRKCVLRCCAECPNINIPYQ